MGRETYFPQLAILCHNAKVVHAFESNTPFEKLPGTQINVPRLNLHSARGTTGAHFPRFRALALFGRRSPQCVDSLVMPGRVDEDVAILIPHSPGCAAFPLPVLQPLKKLEPDATAAPRC